MNVRALLHLHHIQVECFNGEFSFVLCVFVHVDRLHKRFRMCANAGLPANLTLCGVNIAKNFK